MAHARAGPRALLPWLHALLPGRDAGALDAHLADLVERAAHVPPGLHEGHLHRPGGDLRPRARDA
eukprot:12294287-Heterocapsa_arctica.AAC.1